MQAEFLFIRNSRIQFGILGLSVLVFILLISEICPALTTDTSYLLALWNVQFSILSS